jgi:HPt (histidine-containing phosphotransfer) domain-containing protein
MDAYLSKPIKGEELLELVERLGSCSTEVAGPGTSPGVEDRPAAAVSPSEDPGRGTDPRSCADLRAARRPGSCSAGFGRSSVRDVPAMLGEGPSTPPEPSALGTGLALGAGLPAPPESPTAGLQPALEADRLPVCGPGRGRSKRARKRDSKAVHPPAAFDVTEAIACCFGSPDILHQMIDFYFGEAPDLVAQMHAALSARNRREVARAAHRLRGTLVHLAAHPAAAAADRLEQLIAEGNLAEAAEQLAELGRQLERLEAALNAVRRAGAASENRGLAPSG